MRNDEKNEKHIVILSYVDYIDYNRGWKPESSAKGRMIMDDG